MKLLFLPPRPMLTKKGTPRKRNRVMQPGRLFFADGREIPGVARLSVESMPRSISVDSISLSKPLTAPKYFATLLTLEFDSPRVTIIDQPPNEKKAPRSKRNR